MISVTQNKMEWCSLEKYAQVISSEMLACLKESAQQKGISLDMEVALRLMAAMSEPQSFTSNSLTEQILNYNFSQEQAVAECKRKREASLYLYEVEKLRVYLRFEEKLPRNFKEHFNLIDVKAVTEQIKAE